MRSFWSDPYLWVHLTGVAAVPIFLELCLLGLAVGEPFLPAWFELLFVGIVGVAPILWMQWKRPFSIFSLLILALKPEQLTADQRRILRLFKAPIERGLAILTAALLLFGLWWLYQIAPIAAGAADFLPIGRGIGLLGAAIAFLLSNLFLQVPISVLRVLLTSESQFATTEPYPVERISQDFTLLGFQVKKILPQLIVEPAKAKPSESAAPSAATAAAPASEDKAEELKDQVAADRVEEAIAPAEASETSLKANETASSTAPEQSEEAEEENWEDETDADPEISEADAANTQVNPANAEANAQVNAANAEANPGNTEAVATSVSAAEILELEVIEPEIIGEVAEVESVESLTAEVTDVEIVELEIKREASGEADSIEASSGEAESIQTEPVEAEPIEAEFIEAEPAESELVQAEPAQEKAATEDNEH